MIRWDHAMPTYCSLNVRPSQSVEYRVVVRLRMQALSLRSYIFQSRTQSRAFFHIRAMDDSPNLMESILLSSFQKHLSSRSHHIHDEVQPCLLYCLSIFGLVNAKKFKPIGGNQPVNGGGDGKFMWTFSPLILDFTSS